LKTVRHVLRLLIAFGILALAACSSGGGSDEGAAPPASTREDTSSAATSTAPQTTTEAEGEPLRIVKFLSGLSSPLYLTSAPGEPDRLYIVEQSGSILVYENGHLLPQPFLDIQRQIVSGGEQGLLSVAFHPDYEQNGLLYVDYTDTDGNTRVVQYHANADGTAADPSSARVLLTVDQPYPNHNGGQLQFGPDGLLWVGMGDGGSEGDPEDRAQNLGERLGKLLTIDVDAPTPTVRIAAYGVRNPWRFSFDRKTGDLWMGDVGQNDWEEIDHVRRSRLGELMNFGWNALEGRVVYEDKAPNPTGRLVAPIAVYSHDDGSCSVTGGYVYRGIEVPAAEGRYFYGDYCTGTISSLELGQPPRKEPFTVDTLSSFGEDDAGELYLVALNGTIYKLAGG
jgi:glucose/arabinose dehydrogenase